MLFMDLADFYLFVAPLAVLLMLLLPVILYYARKEEHTSKELKQMKEVVKLDSQIMKGSEAIEYLEGFIRELEESEVEDMTEQQAEVMIKVAQVLISSINREKTFLNKLRHTDLIPKLKVAMEKLIQQTSTNDESEVEEQIADRETEVLSKPKSVKIL